MIQKCPGQEHKGLVMVLLIALIFPDIYGGTPSTTSAISPLQSSTLTLNLKKQLDLNNWQGIVYVNRPFAGDGRLEILQNMDVIMHQTSGFHRQWKVNEKFGMNIQKPVTENIQLLLSSDYESFSDQQARDFRSDVRILPLLPNPNLDYSERITESYRNNNIKEFHLGIGGRAQLLEELEIEGISGQIYETRFDQTQQGLRTQLSLNSLNPILGLSYKTTGWQDRIKSNIDNGITATVSGQWGTTGHAQDRLSASYNRIVQREYSIGRSDFNQRRDENFVVYNHLSTGLAAPWEFFWDSELARLSTTHIGQQSRYREFNWKNGLSLVWQDAQWRSMASGGVDLGEQEYTGGLSQGQRTRLGVDATYSPVSTDSLSLKMLAIRYRFDTPDESDFNDRDELRYQISIQGGKSLRHGFGIHFILESDLQHLVYIYQSRSGENRWTRLFRLAVEVPWQSESIENRARYTVVSNYTDYDYAPATEELSRVYRSFTANDTLKVKFSEVFTVEFDMSVTLDDHGRLQWDEWIQDISEDGVGYSFALIPSFMISGYQCSAGWSWHRRTSRIHKAENEVVTGESVYSYGPILILRSVSYQRFRADLSGQFLVIHDKLRGNYNMPDIRCSLIWSLG